MSEYMPKPGDLAMVTADNHPEPYCAYYDERDGGIWRRLDSPSFALVRPATLRPLVVIDPENREQVERLFGYYIGARDTCQQTTGGGGTGLDWMRAALREYANPTLPKPDEPRGLGAVVEDAGGRKWVRDIEAGSQNAPWFCAPAGKVSRREWWINVDAVKVHSQGVTP